MSLLLKLVEKDILSIGTSRLKGLLPTPIYIFYQLSLKMLWIPFSSLSHIWIGIFWCWVQLLIFWINAQSDWLSSLYFSTSSSVPARCSNPWGPSPRYPVPGSFSWWIQQCRWWQFGNKDVQSWKISPSLILHTVSQLLDTVTVYLIWHIWVLGSEDMLPVYKLSKQ